VKIRHRHRVAAGLFAPPARIATKAAMFMMRRVVHAFIAAAVAHFRAEAEHRPGDGFAGASLPHSQKSRCVARIRAVQIHADAFAQSTHIFLAKTRIGASSARLSAIEAGYGGSEGNLIHFATNRRMSVEHSF
jgi:hypothetical protein